MPNLFQNKYRIPSNRLPGYDYGADGWYCAHAPSQMRFCCNLLSLVETRNCASLPITTNNPLTKTKNPYPGGCQVIVYLRVVING